MYFKVLILTALIVIAIYIISYRRMKAKRSEKQIDSVSRYHASRDRIQARSDMRNRENAYKKYVTKYNSSEDYREK